MKRIDIVASEATFEMLGTFETLEGLNKAVRDYKCKFKEILSGTEISVLDILHRYSAKYKGVSFLCKNTIGKQVGKSRRTIIRVCQRLEELGIIRQYAMKRASDMQQTSNAIVILSPVVSELPVKLDVVDENEAPVTQEPAENVTPRKQLPSKTNTYTKERTARPAWIPHAFFALLDSHIHNVKEIEEYWRSVYAITYRMKMAQEVRATIGIKAFIAMKSKRKKLRKPIAYFTGAVKRLAKQRYVNELFDDVFMLQ
ncbi:MULTISPECIES: helix-turn-helix domain-containing protein [unclassified Cytobacillus]|uniref:helix-turn-helix domain-containing protein n=1 Tax=unclassified Cytobacillus TaxID=2675268 RepID=UPI00203C6E82|nr:helix-turn-helix domain-containing protein [Cytobacillus sp. AMY 15.2]MCM3093837.1 helix-turn-helix domain-containing protein [Cytobacillus sp. AMY 15.2]